MKLWTSLVTRLRTLAGRSKLITESYDWLCLLYPILVKDLLNLRKNIRKIKLILAVKPYTLLGLPRISALYELACQLERENKSGNFVECGVCNGGSAAIVSLVAKHNINRHVWLFDSWKGMPEPGERDYAYDLKPGEKGIALASEERVKELLFTRFQLDSSRVHLAKGWFEDTLPGAQIGTIALLHLDCDWYESVNFCLEQLYDDVINGGFIVIDDYGHWKGCKEAVDEFVKSRNLKVELIK